MNQFTMVGAGFRPVEARDIVKQLSIGAPVTLVADPDNPYDSNAVQVVVDDVHIGFVPKEENGVLAMVLRGGQTLEAEVIAFESTLKPVIEYDLSDVA